MSDSTVTEVYDEISAPKCFVICPIGDQDAEIGSQPRDIWENNVELFEEVIKPACAAFGLDPIRADQIAKTGEIPEQICRRLREDDVVIADLTGGNPNVMYELGLRHTLDKLTIQLGETGKLPFDVAAIRTIKFQRSERGLVQARKRLSEALSVGLNSSGDLVTATRIWLDMPSWPVGLSTGEESDEPGFLEKLADLEGNLEKLPKDMEAAGNLMSAMTQLTKEMGERVDKANSGRASASVRLLLTNKLCEKLAPHIDKLEEVAVDYQLAVEKVDPGVRHVLGVLPQNLEEEKSIDELRSSVRDLIPSVHEYIAASKNLRVQLKEAGAASRSLRQVNGRISATLAKMISASELVILWGDLLGEHG